LTIVQKEIDLNIASERISELVELNLLTTNPDKDFIRFLSESREQAFSYIEVAQEAIAYLALAIKEEDADKLILAQNNLISLLPENMIK
jgi:hypothetical protein